jgi:hypothetical protein
VSGLRGGEEQVQGSGVSRRIAALGSIGDIEQPETLSILHVARINASVVRGVTEVYCSEPEFTVLKGQYVLRIEIPANASPK